MPRNKLETTIGKTRFKHVQLGGDTADEIVMRLGRGLGMSDLSVADMKWAKAQFVAATEIGIVDEAGDKQTRFVPLSTVYDEVLAGPEGRKTAGELFKWIWEANFGSFFDVLRSIGAARRGLWSSSSPTDAAGAPAASSSPSA